MMKRCKQVLCRNLCSASGGVTLVEVTIAIIVLALVVGAVLSAMVVVFNMQTHQDQQRIAEYLTRNQFEYIKTQPYIWGNVTGGSTWKGYPPHYDTVPFTQSYFLDVVAIPVDKDNYTALPVLPGPLVEDQGIQKIIISVYSDRKSLVPVLVTTNYKVYR
jgi:Tfp pilus assembly protein PilV